MQLLSQYRNIGAGFGVLLLIISGLAIWMTISSALRPLREVERTAAAVAAGDIGQRLLERPGKTEIGRINRSLNTMLGSIESALSSRNQTVAQMRRFIADASHELRTPLVSVRGYAELYRMGALKRPEDVAEAMGRIESEAVRMTGLVESLLTLARMDESTELKTSSTDLVALARDAAKDVSVADHNRAILINDFSGRALRPETQILADVDAGQLRQVFTNLLANAARFSPAGEPIEVAIATAPNSLVIIDVRDSGEGIPKELREKVFERFFRADSSRNRDTGGSGLGLAIVKGIVTRHSGSIVADETAGGGCTMRVTLPQHQPRTRG
jgi:two-component system OmpR family sensor kinase